MRFFKYISAFVMITGLLAVAQSATAAFSFEEQSVSIEIIGGDSLSVDPGAVVTLVYKIQSDDKIEQTLTPSFIIPDGWSIVFGSDALTLSGNQPTTRFVTYKIPENALAAVYRVHLALLDEANNEVVSNTTPVSVNTIYALDLDADPIETYAAAGKVIEARFLLSNDGNAPITVHLDALDRRFANVHLPYSSIELDPAETTSFIATINTDANLDHTQRASLRFEARISGKSDIIDYETLAFDIVPVYSRIRPKAANTPISLAIETVGDESGILPQATIAAQVNMLGGDVSIMATLAEMPRQKFFGADQRLAIEYKRDDVTVKIGDHSQSISPMTLTGEQGLGLAAQVETPKWNFKGTAQRSRYVFPVQERIAVSAAYNTSSSSLVSANLLHRNEFYDGTLFTLRSLSQPLGASSRLDVECGIDSSEALRDPSCSAVISNSGSRLSYRIRAQKASASFPGSIAGVKQISEYASIRLSERFRIDNSYRRLERALGAGFERFTSFSKAGITYTDRLWGGTLYLTSHGIRSHSVYTNVLSDIDRTELMVRSTLGFHMRSIGLTVSVEEGRTSSSTETETGALRRIKTNFRVSPLSGWTLNGSIESSSGSLSALSSRQSQKQYGFGSTIAFRGGWAASVSAFHSDVKTLISQQYSSMRAGMTKSFRSGQTLSAQVQVNRSVGRNTVQTADYKLSYVTPLALPFGLGASESDLLRGRITDQDSGMPVSGALVFLGESLAISDEQGRFVLPRPEFAIEFLRIDQNSIGYDRIPITSMPMEIEPSSFLETELVLVVSRASSISGQIQVFQSPESPDLLLGSKDLSLVHNGGIPGAIVELVGKEYRRRTRTSHDGSFRFEQLPPGDYTIEVLRANVPESQRLIKRSLNVSLEHGATNTVNFRVEPVRKTIRMIQTSSLSLGEGLVPSNTISPAQAISPSEANVPSKAGVLSKAGARSNTSSPTNTPSPSNTESKQTDPSPQHDDYDDGGNEAEGDRTPADQSIEDGWFSLMQETAREAETKRMVQASLVSIPYYLEIQPFENQKRSSLALLLFILCVFFVLVDIDLLVRRAIKNARGPIRSMTTTRSVWTIRQSVLYAIGIGFVSTSLGVLEGFALALALSGISVAIETANTYKAIFNIVYLTFYRRSRIGDWIPYRDGVARLVSVSIDTTDLELLSGHHIQLATHNLRSLSPNRWSSQSVTFEKHEIAFSRMSNLKHVRACIEDSLTQFAPQDTTKHFQIEFVDKSVSETTAEVKIVASQLSEDHSIVRAVIEKELGANGIELKTATASELAPKFGPLRLIRGANAA